MSKRVRFGWKCSSRRLLHGADRAGGPNLRAAADLRLCSMFRPVAERNRRPFRSQPRHPSTSTLKIAFAAFSSVPSRLRQAGKAAIPATEGKNGMLVLREPSRNRLEDRQHRIRAEHQPLKIWHAP